MVELSPIDCSARGLREAAELLREVFPAATHLSPEYLDWQYNRNPAGPVVGMNAHAGGALVGHYATIPLRIRLFGKPAVAALLLNIAIRRDHRGQRLMGRMGRRTLEDGRHAGVHCLFGIANDASTPGIAYPLGMVKVGRLEARIGCGPLPPRRADARPPLFEREWDRETMEWRLANPSVRYWLRRRADRCDVFRPTGQLGVVAFLGSVDRDVAAEGLPAPRSLALRPHLWLGLDAARRWGASAWWNLPRRLRPVPLNFMFRDLAEPPRPLTPRDILFTGLDFDAY